MAARVQHLSGMTTQQTYSIAHSAQCKLNLAANRPDRNLRFVLGHAFTLDKVLMRIVEIENQSAKDQFDNSKPDDDTAAAGKSEIQEADELRSGVGGGAGVTVGETGSLARPPRRISFSNQTKPSEFTGQQQKESRAKSPPPKQKKQIPKGYEDDASTSSDDYDDYDDDNTPSFSRAANPPSSTRPPANAESDSDDDNDKAIDDYEDEDAGLGLQRFASASAAPPRKRTQSPPPGSPPMLSDDSDSDEDDLPPKSPPSFPDDVVRGVMVEGDEASDLHTIYETIRGCPCGKDHGVAPESKGMWEIKSDKVGGEDGRDVRYGVVRCD